MLLNNKIDRYKKTPKKHKNTPCESRALWTIFVTNFGTSGRRPGSVQTGRPSLSQARTRIDETLQLHPFEPGECFCRAFLQHKRVTRSISRHFSVDFGLDIKVAVFPAPLRPEPPVCEGAGNGILWPNRADAGFRCTTGWVQVWLSGVQQTLPQSVAFDRASGR
jgi:hypothetical protein